MMRCGGGCSLVLLPGPGSGRRGGDSQGLHNRATLWDHHQPGQDRDQNRASLQTKIKGDPNKCIISFSFFFRYLCFMFCIYKSDVQRVRYLRKDKRKIIHFLWDTLLVGWRQVLSTSYVIIILIKGAKCGYFFEVFYEALTLESFWRIS